MMALWNGILFGLLLTIFIGPVFFALIQTSIEKGFYAGLYMAFGIALSDALYMTITYVGFSQLFNSDNINLGLGIVGGIIMIGFGISSFFKRVDTAKVQEARVPGTVGLSKQIFKGFLLNGINPSVLVFWIGIASMATVNYHYSGSDVILFFSAIITTVFLTDVLKAYIAHKLKKLLTSSFILVLNRIVGVGLILFGFRLFYFVIEG